MSFSKNKLFKFAFAGLACLSLAAVTPQEGQLIELKNFVNARSESKFRKSDANKIYQLRQGTKAVIGEKPVEFKDPKTKVPYAYGLCLKILNADVSTKKDCYWVYYKESAKNLEIHDVQGDEQKKLLESWKAESKKKVPVTVLNEEFKTNAGADSKKEKVAAKKAEPAPKLTNTPKENLPVHVTEETTSYHEPHYPKPKVSAPEPKPKAQLKSYKKDFPAPKEDSSGADSMNAAVIAKATEINARLNTDGLKPEPAKNGCDGKCATPALGKGEVCKPGKNDYLEKDIEDLQKNPQTIIAHLLNGNQPAKFIKDECFATALQFKGGSYKTCIGGKAATKVDRPCATDNLKKVVRTSFDMTMTCLGEYLTSDAKTVNSAAENFFFMISHESGHNPNAVSWSGAGGSSQLTDPLDEKNRPAGAIAHFNRSEKEVMMDYLNKKNDPQCSPIQQALNQGMGEGPQNSCDRISLQKGNPLLNLVYGLGYQKFLRRNVTKLMTQNPMAIRIFGKAEPQTKEFLENQLSLWGHNTGPSGMTGAIIRYLAKHPNKEVVTIKDATEMLSAMKSSIKAEGRNISEPVNYLAAVNKRSEHIQKSTGVGTCTVK